MTIKKSRLINLRIDDQLLDEIELIADEKFNEVTSVAIRYLVKLGIKFDELSLLKLPKKRLKK